MTCRQNVSLGAYVLGALEPAERSAMEHHISECASCREELLSFAPLPGLLRHTPFEELPELSGVVEGDLADPPAGDPLLPHLGRQQPSRGGGPDPRWPGRHDPEDAPRAKSSAGRGRRRGMVIGIGVTLAGLASALIVFVAAPFDDNSGDNPSRPPAAAAMTLSATDPDTHVWASAGVTPTAWGSAIDLKLNNLPDNVRCALVVHDRGGNAETAGSWSSGYYGSTSLPASTSISPDDITRIDVVTDSRELLVSMPRR